MFGLSRLFLIAPQICYGWIEGEYPFSRLGRHLNTKWHINSAQLIKWLATALFIVLKLLALGQVPFFRSFTVESGLPSSSGYKVVQDQKGYIWLGTDRGVSRYNGTTFSNFSTKDGLSGNSVFYVDVGSDGSIWFNHFNKSLSYFKDGTIQLYPHREALSNWVGSGKLGIMHLDDQDRLWIGVSRSSLETSTSCIAYIDSTGQLFEQGLTVGSAQIVIKSFRDGNFVIGNRGFFRDSAQIAWINDASSSTFHIRIDSSVQQGVISCIASDSTLYLGLQGNLIRMGSQGVTKKFVGKMNQSLSLTQSGHLWLGLEDGGAIELDPNSLKVIRNILSKFSVTSVLQDHEGGHWFSTKQNGLHYCSSFRPKLIKGKTAELSNRISDMSQRNDTVWLSHATGEISLHSPKQALYTEYISGYIAHLSLIGNKMIICSTTSGATSGAVRSSLSNSLIHPFALSSAIGAPGVLWFGGSGGLLKRSLPNYRLEPFSSQFRERTETLYYRDDTLWIGTLNGLYIMVNEVISPFQSNSTFKARIIGLYAGKEFLMVGTKAHGIAVRKTGRKIRFIEQEALRSDFTNTIEVYNDSIWLGTSKGISVVDPNDKELRTINYDMGNDLPTNEIDQLVHTSDGLWFSSYLGLGFLPYGRFGPHKAPLTYITAVNHLGSTHESTKEVYDLKYSENSVEIEFESVGYKKSAPREFEYRFPPLQKEWKRTQHSAAQFNSLAPGDYKFEVRSIDYADKTSSQSDEVYIKIQQAYWHTIGFRTLVLFSILALLWFIYRVSVARLKRRHDTQQELEKLNSALLRTQMNPHFIFNSLNSIQSFIVKNDTRNSMRYLSRFSKLMRRIFEHSAKDIVTLETELKTVSLYIELENQRRRKSIRLNIDLSPDLKSSEVKIPPMLLQPFIENAVVHGLTHSTEAELIHLSIQKNNNTLCFTLRNEGLPITAEKALELKNAIGSAIPINELKASNSFLLTIERITRFNRKCGYKGAIGFDIAPVNTNDSGSGTVLKFNIALNEN